MTSTGRTSPVPVSPWLVVGRVSAALSFPICVLLQALHHDFFPPEISVSQYGTGPTGWVFTLWTVTLSLAVLALVIGGPELYSARAHGAHLWLAIGSSGLLVMGVVRTDVGGAQHSWHAKVHTAASIVGLLAIPIGMALALSWARTWWRRAAWSLVVLSDAALLLVLVSAFGVATPGLDAPHSWALWQAVAVTVDMVFVGVFALAGFSGQRRPTEDGASLPPIPARATGGVSGGESR